MKNYMKPSVSFQFVSLVNNVSVGCILDFNQAQYSCPVDLPDLPGDSIFAVSPSPCTYEVENPEDFGLCYHNPNDTARILGS